MARDIRRLPMRSADGSWHDVIIEQRKISQPCRTRPAERLVEHGRELRGTLHGRPVRLVLRLASDGTRLWEVAP